MLTVNINNLNLNMYSPNNLHLTNGGNTFKQVNHKCNCDKQKKMQEVTEVALKRAVEMALELYDQYYRLREMAN